MDCKTCFNSRTGISENGYHAICTLSAWKSAECITQDYKHYMKSPFDIPQKPVTNADRIRAMTDEELADFLAEQQLDLVETIYGLFKMPVPGYLAGVKDDALDWLRQEVE